MVEDEPGISDFVKQGLEEESYEVTIAPNGNEGLDLALKNDYDLLLLDWMLPGYSGLEICQKVRKRSSVPVIFLTAKDTLEETLMGLQSGANDYIKKPFHFSELLERIKVQLRNKIEENGTKLVLGEITMNLDTYQVFKNEEEVVLTQREFELLKFLIENKGRVCRRDQIIEKVWDIHFDYSTGVIDVFINSLRKKLSLSEKDNYIQTIRGVGYIAREL